MEQWALAGLQWFLLWRAALWQGHGRRLSEQDYRAVPHPGGKGGGSRCALGEWAKIRFVLDLLPCFRLLASCLLTRVEEVPREHSFLP